MGKAYSLSEIAALIQGELHGDPQKKIAGVSSITDATEVDIVYVENRRFLKELIGSRAGAAIVPPGYPLPELSSIVTERPRLAFAKVAQLFHPLVPPVNKGIHATAILDGSVVRGDDISIGAYSVVGKDVKLGQGVVIGSMCCIGDGVEIGDRSYLFPGVIVREAVRIGKDCIIHPGAVLGSDGFGFEPDANGRYVKIPQKGILVIEDEVEIGANVTIDRATGGTTRIGRGVKLDNLIHIAHNVGIENDCLLCAQVGIAGSTKIGQGSVLGGQVGVVDHVEIGHHVRIGAQAGVTKSVRAMETISGYPARPHKLALKREAMLSRLERMYGMIEELKSRIDELEREMADEKRKSERIG
jgi:UDP-3-O-[3-hydroxymyristoyl] glucosamine N-acyltransferase